MDQQTAKYIIFAGIIIFIVGVLFYFFHDKLHWIGRLPGDFRIEKENFRLYAPLTTMILLSLLLTLLFYFIRKL